MTDFTTILYDVTDDVATITLNRPEVMNALNRTMRAEITTAIARAETEARCLVLTGTGRAFCSGQDLADAGGAPIDLGRILREEYEPMLAALTGCRLPTIAAVNGSAAGAGANLALGADVVIATESARFIQAFTKIGLIPDAGGTYWLPRQVGFARAMGTMLFAEPVTARQAADWGMIWDCVADADFAAHVTARARHLAQGPGLAYAAIKRALREGHTDLAEQLALEAELQAACGQTADFHEGVMAFLQKRPPRFTGA
ncbi:enoyl-CoA hydratase-related protein [Paracoccus sp. p4-l81]|uniref:enoyl-CoA hydratase-related protein n=1 Tax=unclassified Paracoccus (in: a-proteobacteria) TaxID=2688777 RepID=UPI0035BA3009